MSDPRQDPLYNTLNEFDFIVFVQLETELFHTEFSGQCPHYTTLLGFSDCDWEGVLLLYFASQDRADW